MSNSITAETPCPRMVGVPTTIHVPISGQTVKVTTTSEHDIVNGVLSVPPFYIGMAPVQIFHTEYSNDYPGKIKRIDIFIVPDKTLRCRNKKRFQKLLMSLSGYGRNAAAEATAGNYDRWTCHGLERSECYQLKWLKAIFPAPQFTVDFRSPVDNAPLKTKDFAYEHFMGKIAAENLWREYEQKRLKGKEDNNDPA